MFKMLKLSALMVFVPYLLTAQIVLDFDTNELQNAIGTGQSMDDQYAAFDGFIVSVK